MPILNIKKLLITVFMIAVTFTMVFGDYDDKMSVRYMRKKKSGFDNHEEEIDDGAPTGTIYIARFKPNPFHMWADLVGNPKVPASSFLVKKRPFARSGGNILLG